MLQFAKSPLPCGSSGGPRVEPEDDPDDDPDEDPDEDPEDDPEDDPEEEPDVDPEEDPEDDPEEEPDVDPEEDPEDDPEEEPEVDPEEDPDDEPLDDPPSSPMKGFCAVLPHPPTAKRAAKSSDAENIPRFNKANLRLIRASKTSLGRNRARGNRAFDAVTTHRA